MLGAQAGQQEDWWQQGMEGPRAGETNQVAWFALRGKTSSWNNKVQGDEGPWVSIKTDTDIQDVLPRCWEHKPSLCTSKAGRSYVSNLVG